MLPTVSVCVSAWPCCWATACSCCTNCSAAWPSFAVHSWRMHWVPAWVCVWGSNSTKGHANRTMFDNLLEAWSMLCVMAQEHPQIDHAPQDCSCQSFAAAACACPAAYVAPYNCIPAAAEHTRTHLLCCFAASSLAPAACTSPAASHPAAAGCPLLGTCVMSGQCACRWHLEACIISHISHATEIMHHAYHMQQRGSTSLARLWHCTPPKSKTLPQGSSTIERTGWWCRGHDCSHILSCRDAPSSICYSMVGCNNAVASPNQ